MICPLVFQDVTAQPGMGFDPLPPLDSVTPYTRPERYIVQNIHYEYTSDILVESRFESSIFTPEKGECKCLCGNFVVHVTPGLRWELRTKVPCHCSSAP